MLLNQKIIEELIRIQSGERNYEGELDKYDPLVTTCHTKKNNYLVRLQLKIEDSKITAVKFNAFACTIVIASMNIACDMLINKTLGEALMFTNDEFAVILEMENEPEYEKLMVRESIHKTIEKYILDSNDNPEESEDS